MKFLRKKKEPRKSVFSSQDDGRGEMPGRRRPGKRPSLRGIHVPRWLSLVLAGVFLIAAAGGGGYAAGKDNAAYVCNAAVKDAVEFLEKNPGLPERLASYEEDALELKERVKFAAAVDNIVGQIMMNPFTGEGIEVFLEEAPYAGIVIESIVIALDEIVRFYNSLDQIVNMTEVSTSIGTFQKEPNCENLASMAEVIGQVDSPEWEEKSEELTTSQNRIRIVVEQLDKIHDPIEGMDSSIIQQALNWVSEMLYKLEEPLREFDAELTSLAEDYEQGRMLVIDLKDKIDDRAYQALTGRE